MAQVCPSRSANFRSVPVQIKYADRPPPFTFHIIYQSERAILKGQYQMNSVILRANRLRIEWPRERGTWSGTFKKETVNQVVEREYTRAAGQNEKQTGSLKECIYIGLGKNEYLNDQQLLNK